MSNEKQPAKDIFDEITDARLKASVQAEKDQYKKDLKEASIAAMQGLLANSSFSIYSTGAIAEVSILQAKALLKRLEEEGK